MSVFIDFYQKMAGRWYVVLISLNDKKESKDWQYAKREFEMYRQAANLPHDWQPEQKEE